MFGHQNNDSDNSQNTTNPALPGSFPAMPVASDSSAPFNPALPSTVNAHWEGSNGNDSPAAPAVDAPISDNITPPDTAGTTVPVATDDLLNIKQQALSQLSPLVSHLDQTPEEKFRTTMMMIQATDNQDLIKDAYAAAQSITDEKAKAQALLDIVNEINYFTQHQA